VILQLVPLGYKRSLSIINVKQSLHERPPSHSSRSIKAGYWNKGFKGIHLGFKFLEVFCVDLNEGLALTVRWFIKSKIRSCTEYTSYPGIMEVPVNEYNVFNLANGRINHLRGH